MVSPVFEPRAKCSPEGCPVTAAVVTQEGTAAEYLELEAFHEVAFIIRKIKIITPLLRKQKFLFTFPFTLVSSCFLTRMFSRKLRVSAGQWLKCTSNTNPPALYNYMCFRSSGPGCQNLHNVFFQPRTPRDWI